MEIVSKKKASKHCLIITGGFSANKGDQAIMEASQALYAKFLPDFGLTFESPFPGVISSLRSISRVIKQDIVLVNVGHPIQDTTSLLYIPAVFWRLLLGIAGGKQVGMIAGGVSELRSKFLKWLVIWILNRSIIVSVRDKESAERLRRWGLANNIIVAADPALLVEPAATEKTEDFLQSLPAGPIIGFAPRRWFHYKSSLLPIRKKHRPVATSVEASQYQNALIDAIDYVINELEGTAVLISMKPGSASMPGQDDDVFAQELRAKIDRPEQVILMPNSFTPAEVKYCLSYFQLLVGVRMHATILALASMVPCLNIYYNEKGVSLFHSLNLENYAISIESCTSGLLMKLIEEMWLNQDSIRQQLAVELPKLKSKVSLPYQYLRDNVQ